MTFLKNSMAFDRNVIRLPMNNLYAPLPAVMVLARVHQVFEQDP